MEGTALCWKCERKIEGGVFSPEIETSSGNASACNKCATHKWIVKKEGKEIRIKRELIK